MCRCQVARQDWRDARQHAPRQCHVRPRSESASGRAARHHGRRRAWPRRASRGWGRALRSDEPRRRSDGTDGRWLAMWALAAWPLSATADEKGTFPGRGTDDARAAEFQEPPVGGLLSFRGLRHFDVHACLVGPCAPNSPPPHGENGITHGTRPHRTPAEKAHTPSPPSRALPTTLCRNSHRDRGEPASAPPRGGSCALSPAGLACACVISLMRWSGKASRVPGPGCQCSAPRRTRAAPAPRSAPRPTRASPSCVRAFHPPGGRATSLDTHIHIARRRP